MEEGVFSFHSCPKAFRFKYKTSLVLRGARRERGSHHTFLNPLAISLSLCQLLTHACVHEGSVPALEPEVCLSGCPRPSPFPRRRARVTPVNSEVFRVRIWTFPLVLRLEILSPA
jgi:hypothetical protein